MSAPDFPRNLFFDARDRPELRPAEYFHTAGTPQGEVDAAAARLRDEVERRSRLMGRAIRDLEQALRAVKQLRDQDAVGFGDSWVGYAEAVKERANASFEALLNAVDSAYERHEENRGRTRKGLDPAIAVVDETTTEAKSLPGIVVDITPDLSALEKLRLRPSPADVARAFGRAL